MKIEIYGKPNCNWCEKAKLLDEKYDYYDITDATNKTVLMSRNPNARTVPQIFINDELIGGYEQYRDYLINNSD